MGELVNSSMLKEIGDGVFTASLKTGQTVGAFADGAVRTAAGVAFADEALKKRGLGEMGDSLVETATNVGNGVAHVCRSGKMVVDGLANNDMDRALKGGAELVKTAAIAALAVGVLDIIDIADAPGDDVGDTTALARVGEVASTPDIADAPGDDVTLVENPNTHAVQAHARVLPSGQTVWVDGDGDTSVNTRDGWFQSNPDYRV